MVKNGLSIPQQSHHCENPFINHFRILLCVDQIFIFKTMHPYPQPTSFVGLTRRKRTGLGFGGKKPTALHKEFDPQAVRIRHKILCD